MEKCFDMVLTSVVSQQPGVQLEAEMAILDIWNAKKLHEQEKQCPVHLQDFLYLYLVR